MSDRRCTSVLLALMLVSPVCLAHVPDSVVFSFMVAVAVAKLWPFVLPAFFLRTSPSKVRTYLLFVVMALGTTELLKSLPELVIFAATYVAEPAYSVAMAVAANSLANLAAFGFCLWYFRAHRRNEEKRLSRMVCNGRPDPANVTPPM